MGREVRRQATVEAVDIEVLHGDLKLIFAVYHRCLHF